jgi:TPR repeat protein
VDNNDAEAFRLNCIAAEDGMHDAVLAMGWFYLNGVGVEADEDEAIRWYRRSARQGEPHAMFSLGYIAYFRKDYSEALKWFERALSKNHHRSSFWIGKIYWRGQGVDRDRKRAQSYFAQASQKKVEEAQRAVRFLAFLSGRKRATSD